MVEHDSDAARPDAKRRKVRKGTQSCWECKRRKVRCISSSLSGNCDNCRRRNTTCISQEYPDKQVTSIDGSVNARLDRVEHLLEQLLSNSSANLPSQRAPQHNNTSSAIERVSLLNEEIQPLSITAEFTRRSQVQIRSAVDKYEEITRELISAWPQQSDIDLICTLPVGFSTHAHCGICIPSSSFIDRDPSSPRDMLKLPPLGSHPILFARKLLFLGTFLQGVPPSAMQKLGDLRASYLEIMTNAVDKAVKFVTTNDNLTCSVEGLECIMIEAKYHNYSGQIYNSFMAARRAISVAQVMAIHRGFKSPSLRFLESESRKGFDPDQVVYRLVEMDTYLSTMLGIPPSLIETPFASEKALKECHPLDRMERMFFIAGRRVLQRSSTDINDLSITWDIDKYLQQAVDEMSSTDPQWLLDPNTSYLPGIGLDSSKISNIATRTAEQLWYYQVLIRLHLPYMLRPFSDHRFLPNKLTCIHASRETLSRYNNFRISNPAEYYCRGSDYLALVAFTTLCLAYISSAGQVVDHGATSPQVLAQFLAHNRPSARGMMEQTLHIVESTGTINAGNDSIASDISRAMRSLLAAESNAARGMVYKTSSSSGNGGGFEHDIKSADGHKAFQIHIPHFGTIKFEHGVVSRSSSLLENRSTEGRSTLGRPGQDSLDSTLPNRRRNQQPEGFSETQIRQTNETRSVSDSQNYSNPELANITVSPEFLDLSDEWGDLQGVDIALFDSIFCNIDDPDITENSWPQWMDGQ